MKFNLLSNAKINVGLNVLGVLDNGYHDLDMVMLPIALSDTIKGEIFDEIGDLKITTNKKDIPTDERNILYKVYKKFYEKINKKPNRIELYLEKIIPHEAGLGGGSSNGAFFLKFLNDYHNNILTTEEMIKLGKGIGADIPFFIINKPARVRGIGEKLEVFENNLDAKITLIKPNFGVSTALAYKYSDKLKYKKYANIESIIKGFKENNLKLIEENIENTLEQGLIANNDLNIKKFRKSLEKIYKNFIFMSGSGSAYYLFNTGKKEPESMENFEIFQTSFL